jgi:multiple sugar transport system substrate-binding protein
MKEFVQVHNDSWILGPDPIASNPQLVPVSNKIGGLVQDKMRPNTGEVLQGILNGTVSNVEEALKIQNDKLNKNLQDAVKKAKDDGAKVDMEDFHFPKWDGVSNFKDAK